MWLRKLEMKNFGPFRGQVTLDFPRSSGKGLCLLWGTNGAGKTHVYEAIKWCLYGYNPSPGEKVRFPNLKDAWDQIYGTNVGLPPEPYMHVYLWFEEEYQGETRRYLIKRRTKPLRPNPVSHTQIDVDFDVTLDGRLSESPREAVNALLPTAASQFFMFHGEELRKMSQKHVEETRQAIELILEAETFRHGRDDLGTLSRQIDRELDEERRKTRGLEQLLEAKRQTSQKIEGFKEEITKSENELEQKKQELEEVEKKLRMNEASDRLFGQLESLRSQKNQLEEDRKKTLARRSDLITDLPLKLILPELEKVIKKKEEHHKQIEEQSKKINELSGILEFADRMLKQDKCICGTTIREAQRTYIERERQHYADNLSDLQRNLGVEDPTYYQVRETIASIKSTRMDFERFQKDLNDLALRIDEVQNSIRSIEKSLADVNVDLIRQLNSERRTLDQSVGIIVERIRRTKEDLAQQEDFMERIRINIQRSEIQDNIRLSLEAQLRLAERCSAAFNDILTRLSDVRRRAIETHATTVFRKLTNKPDEYDRIEIDANFDVSVIDNSNNVVQRETLSTGEREVVALSFILGLMQASEKVAPLILDTFFVHLDESHYGNIVHALPSFADQIILILTDLEYKNLRERATNDFFDHVANTWQVARNQSEKTSSIAVSTEVAG